MRAPRSGERNGRPTEAPGELVVSHETVKSHVARILMKLGARDRVQAVIAAYEAGLVHPGES
jgi:ATP/maltotriose-dependent transcriptional regulator MalT